MKLHLYSILLFIALYSNGLHAQLRLKTDITKNAKPISKDLVGAFFEDINYAADGGLYAELIQNRSFEYHPYTDSVANVTYLTTQALDSWSIVKRGNALATINVKTDHPIHINNPHYLELSVIYEGTDAGVRNTGFFGIPIVEGNKYPYSIYLRSEVEINYPVIVKLESGLIAIGSDTITGISTEWKKFEGTITSTKTSTNASLVVSSRGRGKVFIDMVSLFPEKTFKDRKNGLRLDLAQTIAELQPRFLRFPGGCISHGRGIDNMYRWKETVGDVAERKPNWNLWGYHQTYGLGFFEYFQYCEDIGAIPLPVVPAGVSCQFRNREIVPMNQMQPFVDDALDLVEFANGDTSTTWGKVRADMGHPEPFRMEYICIGNEEDDIPEFRERMTLITNALRVKYPEIKVIGTSGTAPSGANYDNLWRFSKEQKLDAVDEHYYVQPEWLLGNLHRYDHFDRNGPKVFVGEWASQDDRLKNAVAEAAYMTNLERNGDVVQFSCYAPLLVSEDKVSPWRPDLIRFNNNGIAKTPNYYVQQLFAVHGGDEYYDHSIEYLEFNNNDSIFTGNIGVGTWNTQAKFESVKVESDGAVVFSEEFENGSSSWNVQSGTFAVIGGEYIQSSANIPAWSIHKQSINSTNYSYSLKAMKTGGAEGFIIPFGYKDPQNYYWLNLGGWGNTYHAIEKAVNGVKSTIVGGSGSISNHVWNDIRIEVVKDIASVYLNSEFLFSTPKLDGPIACSVVRDSESNTLSYKIVNTGERDYSAKIAINGVKSNSMVQSVLITGDSPTLQNTLLEPGLVAPVNSSFAMDGDTINCILPANSVQVFSIDLNFTNALINPTETRDDKAEPLRIYPNPSNGSSLIEFENETSNPFTMYVFDSSGKNVIHLGALSKNNNRLELKRGMLGTGVFTIVIHTESKRYIGKLFLTEN